MFRPFTQKSVKKIIYHFRLVVILTPVIELIRRETCMQDILCTALSVLLDGLIASPEAIHVVMMSKSSCSSTLSSIVA